MARRLIATGICLLFSLGAFVFGGPVKPGPLNPFGVLFLVLAGLVWWQWRFIAGHFSPALWDGFSQPLVGREDGRDPHR
ncbi:MAG TPA: hypothetical protein VET89_00480 [Stellaceae bacterium]|jgi:hypothetical protein|nr:hypothetical protein [Stellaceae bacterium]